MVVVSRSEHSRSYGDSLSVLTIQVRQEVIPPTRVIYRTDEVARECFFSLYACLMSIPLSLLTILPCGVYSGIYASAYNHV